MLKFREIGVFLKKPSRDPVGTQSGPNRAPILAFLGTAFGQSGSSRDPVGHQFSNFWHHVWTCREAAKSPKNAQKHCKNVIFYAFGYLPTLVPDWIPTGSRLAKSGAQKCKNWCPIPHLFFPSQTHPCPYFPFPRTSRAPIPPPPAPKRQKQS